MNTAILSILLWIPFCLSVFVTGLIFCITGYRNGIVRAVVGLAATIVATALTVLVANLVSMLFSGGSAGGSVLEIVISMVKRPLLSLLFFWLLMPILTIVFRLLAGKIMGERFKASESWQKWLGLIMGMACAVVFSLFWMSPLYGSVQTAVEVADSVMTAADTQDQETQILISALEDHPLVASTKEGPVSWVYQGTARTGSGLNTFSVTTMMDSAERCIALLTQLENARDVETAAEVATELVNYIHTDVVGQEWFYQMYKSTLSSLQDTVTAMEKAPAAMDKIEDVMGESTMADYSGLMGAGQIGYVPEEVKRILPILRETLDTLDVNKKTFDSNMDNLFGFLSRAMDAGLWIALENEDMQALRDMGIVEDAGWLANSTPEAVAVKRLLIAAFLMDQDEEALVLLEKYDFGMITDPAQQTQEAELLFAIILDDDCSLSEFMQKHPSLGAAVLP